jgi:hypothetical protein
VRLGPAGAIVVLALLASGCGGGGGNGDALSVDEFRDRAEAICRQIEGTDVAQPTGPGDLERYVEEFTGVVERSAADFHELEPPGELRERWDEYLELVDDAVSRVQEFGEEIEDESAADIARIGAEFGDNFTELQERGHELERELGLDDCVD